MKLNYAKADKKDADLLIRLYNESFYDDYVRYGECPAYGKSREEMEASIEKSSKLIILLEDEPVGVISVARKGRGSIIWAVFAFSGLSGEWNRNTGVSSYAKRLS